jgi:hypothetical protein
VVLYRAIRCGEGDRHGGGGSMKKKAAAVAKKTGAGSPKPRRAGRAEGEGSATGGEAAVRNTRDGVIARLLRGDNKGYIIEAADGGKLAMLAATLAPAEAMENPGNAVDAAAKLWFAAAELAAEINVRVGKGSKAVGHFLSGAERAEFFQKAQAAEAKNRDVFPTENDWLELPHDPKTMPQEWTTYSASGDNAAQVTGGGRIQDKKRRKELGERLLVVAKESGLRFRNATLLARALVEAQLATYTPDGYITSTAQLTRFAEDKKKERRKHQTDAERKRRQQGKKQ